MVKIFKEWNNFMPVKKERILQGKNHLCSLARGRSILKRVKISGGLKNDRKVVIVVDLNSLVAL